MSESTANVCDLNEPLKVRMSIQDFQRDIMKCKTKQDRINVFHNYASAFGWFTDNPDCYKHARCE